MELGYDMNKSILREGYKYIDYETGIIYDGDGTHLGYIEMSSNETSIIYRNTEGNIIDSKISGSYVPNTKQTLIDIYKDWNYYDTEAD